MTHDQLFRLILIGLLAIVMPIGLYHRIRSQATGEPLDRRQEGTLILATLRPVGVLLWIAVFAYLISPAWMAWAAIPLPVSLRWAGVVLAVVAGLALTWTLRSIGPNLTDTVVTRRDHTLVMHGPYRWVRHPFYDCVALLLASVGLITANWAILLAAAALLTLLVIRTRKEEENLVARFGDTYVTYMRATGRFLPRRRV